MDSWSPIARVYHPLRAGSIDGTDTRPHDSAVERALKASYLPPDPDSDPHLTLFVARLNPETTEKTLEKVCAKYGDVQQVKIVRDLVTGFSKQYAFVEFEDERGARRARQEMDQSVIEEHVVFVDWECERTLPGWIPRRFGGGFGGQKESGQLRFGGRDRPFRKPIVVSARTENVDDSDRGDRERGGERVRERERHGERREDRERYQRRERERSRERGRDRERSRERERNRGRSREKERDRERRGDTEKETLRNDERGRYKEVDNGEEQGNGEERGRKKESDRKKERDRHRDRNRERDRERTRDDYRERERTDEKGEDKRERNDERDGRRGRYARDEDR